DLSRQPGLFEQSTPPPKRRAATGEVRPAWDSPLLGAPALPVDIRLGTSSWFFPGWRGLVYDGVHPQVALSKQGLAGYAQIPPLRTVSPAREFVVPCLEGLGAKAGPLVFQVSPLPRGLVEEAATLIERLAAFFAAL